MVALGASLTDVMIALGTVYTPRVARVARGATLVLRELQFIAAARPDWAAGARPVFRWLPALPPPRMQNAAWLILAPGLCIVLTVLSLQVVGDGLRDALDPRLRRLTCRRCCSRSKPAGFFFIPMAQSPARWTVSASQSGRASLPIIGQSGSGKSVTSLSIMRLIPTPSGTIADGVVRFRGP